MAQMKSIFWGAGVIALAVAAWVVIDSGSDKAVSGPQPMGSALAVVAVPETFGGQALLGQRGFETKCASCHGDSAAGQDGVAPPLVHKIYEPSHHGDAAFVLAAQNGVRAHHWPFGNMPPVKGVTRADLLNIVAYVRELQRANGIN